MRLRPRQSLFVERRLAALSDHGNTLSIASTGFGKTIALSAVVAKSLEGGDAKACILAHRDELTAQNRAKFGRVSPDITTSVVDAEAKSWAGRATFAMVPTLSRPANLAVMPALDLLVIDEAHHAVADSYRRIIDHVRNANPACRIFGVTATPNRGDRKGLREIFDNVGDQVRLSELIASGHLVPPRTYVIDVGVQDQLRAVRKGRLYTVNQFAEVFENKGGLGGKDAIRDRIAVQATKGAVKFVRNAAPYGLGPSRSRFGYLCVEGMVMPTGGEEVDPETGEVSPARVAVLPTHYKSPQTGALLEVENPHVWVYPEGERQ